MTDKKRSLKPLAIAVGAALTLGVASIPVANANTSPFQGQKLQNGYNLADNHATTDEHASDTAKGDKEDANGKCGDGKCGKAKDGKCGKGKCGKDKKDHGKCGTGKCGS